MSKIDLLKFDNLKGRSDEYRLDPVAVVHGNSMIGKTAILDAAKILLLGYHPDPDLGTTRTKLLFEGGTGRVEGCIGNTSVRREFGQKVPKGEKAPEKPEGIVEDVLLDFRRFLSLSGKERVAYVMERSTVQAVKVEAVIGMLELIPDASRVVEHAKELWEEAKDRDINPKDWLNEVTSWVDGQVLEKNSDLKAATGFARTSSDVRSDSVPRDCKPDIDKVTVELRDIQTRIRKLQGDRPTVDYTIQNRLENEVDKLRKEAFAFRNGAESFARDIDKVKADIRKLDSSECCPFCKSTGDEWKKELRRSFKAMLKQHEAGLEKLEADFDPVKAKLEATEKMFLEVKTENQKPIPANPELKELATKEAVLHTRLSALRDSQDEFTKHIGQQEAEKKATKLRVQTEKELAVLKECLIDLKKVQLASLNAGTKELAEQACRFTDGILAGKLAMEDGEVGYRTEAGEWVTWRTFSGTERALAFIGFQVALCQTSEHRIVLMDELGIVDQGTLVKILTMMKELTADGTIHQFIGATSQPVEKVAGVQMIEVL